MSDHTAALKRGTAGPVLLTGLGLAYVAVGNYVAWGFGVASGGVGGILVALLLVTLMFSCLSACLSELAALYPSAGGGYEFVAQGLGPVIGSIAGAALLLLYVCGVAALSRFASGYVESLTGLGSNATIAILFSFVALLHIAGVSEALGFTLAMAMVEIAGIVAFLAVMVPSWSVDHLVASAQGPTLQALFPEGWLGVWAALPFAVTFFVTLEGMAFAAEEAADPQRNIPIAMFATLGIVAVLGFLSIVAGAGGAGVAAVAGADNPILAALGRLPASGSSGAIKTGITIAAVAGLIASFFGAIYGTSRLVFHLARSGLLPRVFARTNRRHAPWVAVLIGSAAALVLALSGDAAQLVVILIFEATAAYLLFFATHAALRLKAPDMHRPFRCPGGLLVPAIGALLALVVFTACFLADVRWSMIGLGLTLMVATGVIAVYRVRFRGRDLAEPGS